MAMFEVLSETANGHRTVTWVPAADEGAAVVVVEAFLDVGSVVVDSAPAGEDLGSSG